VEESGKALTLLLGGQASPLSLDSQRMLLGAAVGTGFAVFESAGYALDVGIGQSVQA